MPITERASLIAEREYCEDEEEVGRRIVDACLILLRPKSPDMGRPHGAAPEAVDVSTEEDARDRYHWTPDPRDDAEDWLREVGER